MNYEDLLGLIPSVLASLIRHFFFEFRGESLQPISKLCISENLDLKMCRINENTKISGLEQEGLSSY